MRTFFAGAVAGLLFAQGLSLAQEKKIAVTLTVGKDITPPTPVCVPLTLTPEQAEWAVGGLIAEGGVHGQLVMPGVLNDHIKPASARGVRRDLHFILEKAAAGSTVKLNFHLDESKLERAQFSWWDTAKREYTDLVFGFGSDGRKVLRYMYQAYDDSNPDVRNKTYKVFHHLFDPSGKLLVTNGGHTDPFDDAKKLLYPHHRGLQMGFNKVSYGDGFKKKADTWHCQKDDHQSHEGFLQKEGGVVLGRHRVAVNWHGDMKEVMVKEQREMTVFLLQGGTLVEFASRLTAVGGNVKLDGDPQHAGFQFRASNEVAEKTAKQTYYLRPDGKGGLGETRNWDPKKKIGPVDLPWNAMSFVLGDKRYTVCYLDHPSNPHEARHSERDYGRFGCYFEHELTPEKPLVLNYRIWLQEGDMTVGQAQALSNQFVSPPKVVK